MKIGYLVNQYPKVSHSFIRREILAMEAMGHTVVRYSVRECPDDLVDPADLRERDKTLVLLHSSPLKFALDTARALFLSPLRFAKSLATAIRLSRHSESGTLKHLFYFVEACRFVRWVGGGAVDHLHCHFGTNATTVALLARALGGPTFSFTVHGQEEFDKPLSIGLGRKIKDASFVVGISSYGRAQLYRWCDVEEWTKVKLVRCGVDAAFLDGHIDPPPSTPSLVCVGRLCKEKGQPLLLRAVRSLIDAGVPVDLTFVGDGPLRGMIERQIKELDLSEHVRITGYLASEQVRQRIAACKAMVLPSFAEGLPVVIMEAFAGGRPVITTTVAGIPELVEHGISGWLIPPGSAQALASAIRAAVQTPGDKIAEMGRAGAKRVRAFHDVKYEAQTLADLFAEAIREAGTVPASSIDARSSAAAAPARPLVAAETSRSETAESNLEPARAS